MRGSVTIRDGFQFLFYKESDVGIIEVLLGECLCDLVKPLLGVENDSADNFIALQVATQVDAMLVVRQDIPRRLGRILIQD